MFKAELRGFNKQKAQFASATADLKTIISTELDAAGAEWVRNAQRDAPVDQGALKSGITRYMDGDLAVVVVSNAFYSAYREFGTKGKYQAIPGTEQIAAQFKGKGGGDFQELLTAIVRWVARKGIAGTYSVKTRKRLGTKINKYAEDYAAAFPIALSILKNGISPHPFFFKQAEVVWPAMVKRIEQRIKNQSKVTVILPGNINRPQIITV